MPAMSSEYYTTSLSQVCSKVIARIDVCADRVHTQWDSISDSTSVCNQWPSMGVCRPRGPAQCLPRCFGYCERLFLSRAVIHVTYVRLLCIDSMVKNDIRNFVTTPPGLWTEVSLTARCL